MSTAKPTAKEKKPVFWRYTKKKKKTFAETQAMRHEAMIVAGSRGDTAEVQRLDKLIRMAERGHHAATHTKSGKPLDRDAKIQRLMPVIESRHQMASDVIAQAGSFYQKIADPSAFMIWTPDDQPVAMGPRDDCHLVACSPDLMISEDPEEITRIMHSKALYAARQDTRRRPLKEITFSMPKSSDPTSYGEATDRGILLLACSGYDPATTTFFITRHAGQKPDMTDEDQGEHFHLVFVAHDFAQPGGHGACHLASRIWAEQACGAEPGTGQNPSMAMNSTSKKDWDRMHQTAAGMLQKIRPERSEDYDISRAGGTWIFKSAPRYENMEWRIRHALGMDA